MVKIIFNDKTLIWLGAGLLYLSKVNAILVLIGAIFTIIYVGYGIYKRVLECRKLKKENDKAT